MVREGLTEKEAYEQRPEGSEAVSHMVIWTKRFPGARKRSINKYP